MAHLVTRPLKPLAIWWPGWLYELFPFLYAVAGIAAILHFGTPAGYAAGALLLLAALLILKMRSDYRRLNETISLARELMEIRQKRPD